MRLSLVLGTLLILGGVVLAVRGFSYTAQRSKLKVGDFEATLEEKRAVSPWYGAAAVVAGLVVIVAGSRRGGGA